MEKSVFLCHSSKDKPFVREFAERIEKYGIKTWIDEAEIEPGDTIVTKISEGIDKSHYFIAFISNNAIESNWVNYELECAISQEITDGKILVIPVLIDDCTVPSFLKHKCYCNCSNSQNIAIEVNRIAKKIKKTELADELTLEDWNELVKTIAGTVGIVNETYNNIKDLLGFSDADKSEKCYMKANKYFNSKDFESAKSKLIEAINLDQNNTNALNLLAWILSIEQHHLDIALQQIKKAISIQPKTVTYYDTLSEVYYANGNYDKVVEVYKKTLELFEILDDNTKYTFYHRMGRVFCNMGNFEEAIKWLIAAINTKQNDQIFDLASVYYLLSICYMNLRDKMNALSYINQAISLKQNHEFIKIKKIIVENNF